LKSANQNTPHPRGFLLPPSVAATLRAIDKRCQKPLPAIFCCPHESLQERRESRPSFPGEASVATRVAPADVLRIENASAHLLLTALELSGSKPDPVMPFVVTENCIKCKHTDCVEVCPVDCFHEGPNFLVIDPDECI